MLLLVIDTADARGSVGIFSDSAGLFLESHATDDDYSSWLLPAVRIVLDKASLTQPQINAYAVCHGPGSFTGLRVGLTTVKAWSEIDGKPIVPVSRLEALTINLPGTEPPSDPFIASVFDARRDQIFAALYRQTAEGPKRISDEQVTSPSSFLTSVMQIAEGQPVRWRTPDPDSLTTDSSWSFLADHGHVLEKVSPPFADRLAQLALEKFRRGEIRDALSLDADYVRRSDAEIFWKGNPSAFRP